MRAIANGYEYDSDSHDANKNAMNQWKCPRCGAYGYCPALCVNGGIRGNLRGAIRWRVCGSCGKAFETIEVVA